MLNRLENLLDQNDSWEKIPVNQRSKECAGERGTGIAEIEVHG